jgi:sigma-B regulation protein RsbU (phosphoserine phosphatase)
MGKEVMDEKEDLELARAVQRALLPRQLPVVPRAASPAEGAVRFHTFFRGAPAVGGDFFRVRRLSDWSVGVLLCDVMGRGVRAALLSAMLRVLADSLEEWGEEPGLFLTFLNRTLWAALRGVGGPLFSTACYTVLDLERGRLRLANAAHPCPVRVGPAGRGSRVLRGREGCGPLMGVFEPAVYRTLEFPLECGDVVWLFSDGLQKAENPEGEVFGEERVRRVLEGEAVPQEQEFRPGAQREGRRGRGGEKGRVLLEAIERFCGGRGLSDDVCLVGLEVERLATVSSPVLNRAGVPSS